MGLVACAVPPSPDKVNRRLLHSSVVAPHICDAACWWALAGDTRGVGSQQPDGGARRVVPGHRSCAPMALGATCGTWARPARLRTGSRVGQQHRPHHARALRMRARAAGSEGGDDAGIQFDRLRPSQAPPLVGWRGRDIPDVAEGRRENTEFTRELTPYGLYLQEAVVSTAGSTLPDEPVWFRFKAEVSLVPTHPHHSKRGRRFLRNEALRSAGAQSTSALSLGCNWGAGLCLALQSLCGRFD